jgi:hypothetical protein
MTPEERKIASDILQKSRDKMYKKILW